MRLVLLISFFLIFLKPSGSCQPEDGQQPIILEQTQSGGDTLPLVRLDAINIQSRQFSDPFEEARFNKLRQKVIKVYPYALMAKTIIAEIDSNIEKAGRRRAVKKYKKSKEAQLMDSFKEEISNLTVSQGKILVKLINRETGNSCYRLIRELKGGIAAFIWQRVAKRWDYDLKEKYVPEDEPDLEFIIKTLEPTFDDI